MLCQDTDYEVRAAMCQQLEYIARSVGPNVSQVDLVYELQELLKDEELSVKSAALTTFVNLSDFFEKKVRKDVIIPQLKGLCTSPPEDMIPIITRLFGEMIHRISGDFEDEDEAMIFYNFFKLLAKKPEVEIRKQAAYNFPAVVKSMGARKYALHLHDTFSQLVRDNSVFVRKTIAYGFHEIATILGKERCVKYLKDSFIYLLQDDVIEVKIALADHFDQTLSMFAISNEEQKTSTYAELLPLIVEYQASLSKNWRVTQTLLMQFVNLPEYYSSDQIYEQFVPFTFRLMDDGTAPVKEQAAKNICHYMKRNRKNYQRSNICAQLVQRFGRKKCCYSRLVYVDICLSALELFSRKFFREHLFDAALELGRDLVPNVRVKFCKLAVPLRRILRGAYDEPAIRRFDDVMDSLTDDKDRDVMEAARNVLSQIQQDILNRPLSPSIEANDKKKEEEEKSILGSMDPSDYDPIGRREIDFDKNRSDFRKRFVEPDVLTGKGKLAAAKPQPRLSLGPPGRPSTLASDTTENRFPTTAKLSLPNALKKTTYTGQGGPASSNGAGGSLSNSSSASSVSSLAAMFAPQNGTSSSYQSSSNGLASKLPKPMPAGTPSTSTSTSTSTSLPSTLAKLPTREQDAANGRARSLSGKYSDDGNNRPSSYTGTLPSVPSASARGAATKSSGSDRGIRGSLEAARSEISGANGYTGQGSTSAVAGYASKSDRSYNLAAKLDRSLAGGYGNSPNMASVSSSIAMPSTLSHNGFEGGVNSGIGQNGAGSSANSNRGRRF